MVHVASQPSQALPTDARLAVQTAGDLSNWSASNRAPINHEGKPIELRTFKAGIDLKIGVPLYSKTGPVTLEVTRKFGHDRKTVSYSSKKVPLTTRLQLDSLREEMQASNQPRIDYISKIASSPADALRHLLKAKDLRITSSDQYDGSKEYTLSSRAAAYSMTISKFVLSAALPATELLPALSRGGRGALHLLYGRTNTKLRQELYKEVDTAAKSKKR